MNKGNEKLGWMQSLKAVQDLPPGVWEGLVGAGFGDPRLFVTLGDDTDEELETLYAGLADKALEPEEISSGVSLLRKAIEQAKVIATQSHKQSWSLTEIERAGVVEERILIQDEKHEILELKRMAKAPDVPKSLGRWPTQRSKLLAEAGDTAHLREEVEEKERARWATKLFELLKEGEFPCIEAIWTQGITPGPKDLVRRFAKGLRASTLRGRVRTARRLSTWFVTVAGKSWPGSSEELGSYLKDRADEPCGRTVFKAIIDMVEFVETVGGVSDSDKTSSPPSISSLVKELQREVSLGLHKPKKKAKPILMALLGGWERFVVDNNQPRYPRAYAWLKAVMTWASLRSDDTLGIDPSSLKLDQLGLSMTLNRTKTSGPGKKEEVLYAYVAWEAFIFEKDWLEVGMELWITMSSERDFFVALPSPNLEDLTAKPATYENRSAMTKALGLKLGVGKPEGPTLIAASAVSFWSEHSPRSTLPGMAAVLGVPEKVVNKMGRWRSEQVTSDEYIRHDRVMLCKAQELVANQVRNTFGKS